MNLCKEFPNQSIIHILVARAIEAGAQGSMRCDWILTSQIMSVYMDLTKNDSEQAIVSSSFHAVMKSCGCRVGTILKSLPNDDLEDIRQYAGDDLDRFIGSMNTSGSSLRSMDSLHRRNRLQQSQGQSHSGNQQLGEDVAELLYVSTVLLERRLQGQKHCLELFPSHGALEQVADKSDPKSSSTSQSKPSARIREHHSSRISRRTKTLP